MDKKKITRRRLLTVAGAVLESCGLCCTGLAVLTSRADNPDLALPLDFRDPAAIQSWAESVRPLLVS